MARCDVRVVAHAARAGLGAGLIAAAAPASASFMSGSMLDTAADVIAWGVLLIVPVVGIAVFWMLHVLPEKIAHKRHHPQKDAIKTLCLLSLVFGGMLWPLAWLWAYSRPLAYRMAYGTEKEDAYLVEMGERAEAGELDAATLEVLRDEFRAMAARGSLSSDLRLARARVEARLPRRADETPAAAPRVVTPERSA